jgi:hypothetical protein
VTWMRRLWLAIVLAIIALTWVIVAMIRPTVLVRIGEINRWMSNDELIRVRLNLTPFTATGTTPIDRATIDRLVFYGPLAG